MLEINVKEARQRFRELLDRVEQGEEIVVLRHGKAVARMLSPDAEGNRLPKLDALRRSIASSGTPAHELVREDRDAR